MSFQQKSALTMIGIVVIVYGLYFTFVARQLTTTSADDITYQPWLILATVPLIILAASSHALLAAVTPEAARADNELDHSISLRGERIGRYVLVAGVAAALGLAMAEASQFFIAHALALGLVLSHIAEYGTVVALSRMDAGS